LLEILLTMKKGIFFLLAFLVSFTVFTQDYQCIRDNATYFYSNGTNIKAIQIDSVVSTLEGLMYYNYPSLGPTDNPECLTRFGPSWIGRKVLIKPDGDNIYYNKINEPITIKTTGIVGEYWTCYQFSDGNYVKATIAEIEEMQFLGLTDSVKTITFQACNSSGYPVNHSINDKYLELTKNYGLLRTANFKLFPDLTEGIQGIYYEIFTQFELKGISDPQVGIQNLTLSSIWDFNVGDEIDSESGSFNWPGQSESDAWKRHILQKDFNANGDSVSYLINICGMTEISNPDEFYYIYYNDTIAIKYYIGEDTKIDALPDKVNVLDFDYDYSFIQCSFHPSGKLIKREKKGRLYSFPPDDCIQFLWDEPLDDDRIFIEGLGQFSYFHQVYNYQFESYPVYFKKGEEEWGVQYSFNCADFNTSTKETVNPQEEISFAPNPMHNWSKLTIDNPENKEYQFQLFNSMGILVKEFHFQTNELIIQRENLTNGIYFYILTDSQKVKHNGKLIIR
jgi:hypothetical protein